MKKKKQKDLLDVLIAIETELENKSNRAMVILCASFLDFQLEEILFNFFIKNNKLSKEIFESHMPLNTFSAKISMCYYLGLISMHEHRTLTIIRKIRNEFAHSINIIKFEDSQSIKDLCKNLIIPNKMYVPKELIINAEKAQKFDTNPFYDDTFKNRFIQTCRYLFFYLNTRLFDTEKEKRKEYVAKSSDEIIVQMIEHTISARDKLKKTIQRCRKLLIVKRNKLNMRCDDNEISKKRLDEIEQEICDVEKMHESDADFEDRIESMKLIHEAITESYK